MQCFCPFVLSCLNCPNYFKLQATLMLQIHFCKYRLLIFSGPKLYSLVISYLEIMPNQIELPDEDFDLYIDRLPISPEHLYVQYLDQLMHPEHFI